MSPRNLLALLLSLGAFLPSPARAIDLADELEAFLRLPAVAGREEPARDFIRQRLSQIPVAVGRNGSMVLSIGSGAPRRLVVCPLGEPGFVVTGIQPDGYLRLFRSAGAPVGALWEQAHEGHVVQIGGSRGLVPGAVTLRSVHLMQGPDGGDPAKPFQMEDAWVDVGAESAEEVAELGIRLLDPVSLLRRPVRLAGGRIAAPSARSRAGCLAAVEAARILYTQPGPGTTVFAWTVNDLQNGAAQASLQSHHGPFDATASLDLPVLYPGTPVETVAVADVRRLADSLVTFGGGTPGASPDPPPLPPPPALAPPAAGHEEVASLVGRLIAIPAVSGAEEPVRAEIRKLLPSWAKPEVDAKGNLLVTFGQGKDHVLFVAHMDEVGFRVTEILPNGRLKLETRGGLLSYVWEAQAAQVHGDRGPVPAVFEPREGWSTAEHQSLPGGGPPTVFLGVSSRPEAEALGIRVGSTVTLPKQMFRLGRHRGVGRAFDDRNGCTALLLALQRIDPAQLTRRITFAWVVEEETGLIGSTALAERMTDLLRVHPVDTFVSADTPRESRQYAYAPLGRGAVLRTMDNATLLPRELIDRYLALAGRHGIPIQYGFTGGASDGVAFLPNGTEMIPFSWPGRSSHSPVEVSDFRDVEALIRLIVAATTE